MIFQSLNITSVFSQDYPYDLPFYNFIRYDENKLIFPGDSSSYDNLFSSFSTLTLKGEGRITVLHLGDSHIQADYFSGRVRERLQTFSPGNVGGRGFVFPYRVAQTNNPFNLANQYSGEWEYCRNVERNKDCDLGLSGISVTTYDSTATISLYLKDKDYQKYDFNTVKIFHNFDSTSYTVELNGYLKKVEVSDNDSLGFTQFYLEDYTDTLHLRFVKNAPSQQKFTLHGISLETEDPGVVYHSIGVNGADVASFLRCTYFSQHLKALNPDWVIISLGTNDSYGKSIDSAATYHDFERMVLKVRGVSPEIPILLTTPGDHYRQRRYVNRNTEVVRNIIIDVAKKHDCAVWDYFSVMGGLNSVNFWYKAGLTANDKLHYSKDGYYLQGDLLFTAFLRAYDNYIDKNIINK
ncbi:MAG: hypothetical protein A2W91_02495 [Bacteroidetes bacterium GWF2_38_335]|nr:MAG: hypothetical protein A2W91_02495 [Bacteroidetes bacterium GWF2_38_335]OFY80716.1 MAG: hypothetical protein A2281_05510 [Bacteroidetes bacterium RIFOXYA12_FULL_38_20]